MTLDEAIKHAEEVAEGYKRKLKVYENINENKPLFTEEATECRLCAEEHRQLAEWLKELKQLREQTKWTSVSEGLPKEFEDVICSTNKSEIFIATYLGKMNNGTDCFDDNDGMMWEGDVVAWKPLPKPYKAESEI